jgi:hypothetical protein
MLVIKSAEAPDNNMIMEQSWGNKASTLDIHDSSIYAGVVACPQEYPSDHC